MFPAEIVDHVLSFLQLDHSTLNVCANAHPSLSKLVERHFYAHVALQNFNVRGPGAYHPCDLLKLIVDNPKIAKYVRNLKIDDSVVANYQALGPILAAVTQLQTISLCSSRWDNLHESFRTAFTNCLRLPTLTEVKISLVDSFPLSILDHSSSLKRLSLLGGVYYAPPASSLVYPLLDSLVLSHTSISVDTVTSWLGSRRLRSLEYRGSFQLLSRLLGVCANTLTSLNVAIPLEFRTRYNRSTNASTAFNSVPFSLACLPHLARLTLQATSQQIYCATFKYHHSCLPAIVHLLNTLPSPISLTHLVFDINFYLTENFDASDADWSPLTFFPYFDVIPSIELRVSAETMGTPVPSVELLKNLKQDPHLMQLKVHHSFLINAVEKPDHCAW